MFGALDSINIFLKWKNTGVKYQFIYRLCLSVLEGSLRLLHSGPRMGPTVPHAHFPLNFVMFYSLFQIKREPLEIELLYLLPRQGTG